MNQVFLRGNVGSDPELKQTQSGVPVCTLKMATNRRINDNDYTEWHNLRAWRKTAEAINTFVRKGDSVFIAGELRTDQWEGRDDRVKRYKTYIEVHEFVVQCKSDNV